MENTQTGDQGRSQHVEASRRPGPDGKFFTTVNGSMVLFSDAQPKGGSILEKASFKPQGDFVLIQLLHRGTRSIGLDETVDLTAPGSEAFRAFKSDRIFRFTLNDHGFEWGARTISDTELRTIGQVGDDEVILLDRDGHDTEVKPGDELDLGEAGTEHLRTDKRIITVFFENNPREIPHGTYTTEQLKELFSVQQGYVLELINEEGNLTELKPGQKVRVKDDMRFFEQVPCGGSS